MLTSLNVPVSEVMSRELTVLRPEDSIDRVDQIFKTRSIHHIPIVTTDGQLAGIISKSDFLRINHILCLVDEQRFAKFREKLYRHLVVKEVMTEKVATLSPEDSLPMAADIFRENLFHALPVTDKGILVGLLTTFDLINFCFSQSALLDKN
ncbi:MAG: CBS domain-containing protein [Saprospiraceae bacterium]|nr:CBS domain-containing protein [Saprospiraceae bacterium]